MNRRTILVWIAQHGVLFWSIIVLGLSATPVEDQILSERPVART